MIKPRRLEAAEDDVNAVSNVPPPPPVIATQANSLSCGNTISASAYTAATQTLPPTLVSLALSLLLMLLFFVEGSNAGVVPASVEPLRLRIVVAGVVRPTSIIAGTVVEGKLSDGTTGGFVVGGCVCCVCVCSPNPSAVVTVETSDVVFDFDGFADDDVGVCTSKGQHASNKRAARWGK